MIFPVEVKVNIEGTVDDAVSALLPSQPRKSERRIWFAEDHSGVEEGRLPLLDGGVIVRFRSGDGPDDLTAKLRPSEESQLVGRWSRPFEFEPESLEYRVEGDWSGKRRVLAASAEMERPPGSLLGAVQPGVDAALGLSVIQRQFIDQCARPALQINRLIALGPINAQKWSDVKLGELDVNLERWTVVTHLRPGDGSLLDFLEVSIRVKPKGDDTQKAFESRVERKQRELEETVRGSGVTISELRENKTQRVLTALSAAARSG